MTLNFSSICRLCLGQKDGLLPLFGEDDSLPARIMTFAPVIKVIQVCLQMVIVILDSVMCLQIVYTQGPVHMNAVL
jgi:hypothetical protein